MFNKYRLPYFTLGLGIGIILTSVLYSFNPNVEYKEYSEEEIISTAKELGMVFLKENIVIPDREAQSQVQQETNFEGMVENEIILVVETGDSLEKVSNKLATLGIVESGEDFHKFAKGKNLEKRIRVGTYKLNQKMDYENLIKILTKSS